MKIILCNIVDSNSQLHSALIKCRDGIIWDIVILDDKDTVYVEQISHDLREYVLLPRFFNIHCHLGESVYKISPEDMTDLTIERYIELTEAINGKLTSVERDFLWKQSARITANLQIDNCISGICAARCAEICRQYGLLSMSGYPLMNSIKLKKYAVAGINAFTDYFKQYSTHNCAIGLFFHSLYTNGKNELELARDAMKMGGEFFSVHISEDYITRKRELKTYGKSPIDVLSDYDLLNSRTLIVHGGYLDESDLKKIADANAVMVVCPISNLTLHTRMPDLYEIRKLGIRWCLATDGLITGKSFSITAQARILKQYFPELTFEEIYAAVTVSPAKVFGRNIYTGIIEKGTEAKFIVVNKGKNLTEMVHSLFNTDTLKQIIL